MKIETDNLYEHADGGLYCLMSDDAPYKGQDGNWYHGVIYASPDGRLRSTTETRWTERFTQIPYYDGDDESILQMIRRCNPGNPDLDFLRVFEAWTESEINVTGQMLELAVGAVLMQWVEAIGGNSNLDEGGEFSIAISTEDLQRVLQNYDIERVPEPHGFKFVIRKSFPA